VARVLDQDPAHELMGLDEVYLNPLATVAEPGAQLPQRPRVLVDQAFLGEGVGELAAPVHEQVTVDRLLQLGDRVLELALKQGRVPFEIPDTLVDPTYFGIALTMSAHLPVWLGQNAASPS
jgi:hypothetical protein